MVDVVHIVIDDGAVEDTAIEAIAPTIGGDGCWCIVLRVAIEIGKIGGSARPEVQAFVIVGGWAVRIFSDPCATPVAELPGVATKADRLIIVVQTIAPEHFVALRSRARCVGGMRLVEVHVVAKARVLEHRETTERDLLHACVVQEHIGDVEVAHVPAGDVDALEADSVSEHACHGGGSGDVPVVHCGSVREEHAESTGGLHELAIFVFEGNALVVLGTGEHAGEVGNAAGIPVGQTIERRDTTAVLEHILHGDEFTRIEVGAERPLADLGKNAIAEHACCTIGGGHAEHLGEVLDVGDIPLVDAQDLVQSEAALEHLLHAGAGGHVVPAVHT